MEKKMGQEAMYFALAALMIAVVPQCALAEPIVSASDNANSVEASTDWSKSEDPELADIEAGGFISLEEPIVSEADPKDGDTAFDQDSLPDSSWEAAGLSESEQPVADPLVSSDLYEPEAQFAPEPGVVKSFVLSLDQSASFLLVDPVDVYNPDWQVADAFHQGQVQAALDAFASRVDPDLPTAQKVHMAFDYLAATCEYDWDFNWPDAYDAYGALVTGLSACQGYSQAFMLMMQRLGIPCYVVYGIAFNGYENVSHAWNMVQVDGAWYHVDVTWADLFDPQVPDILPSRLGKDGVPHGYLLCSDEQIRADRYWLADEDMPHSCPRAYEFAAVDQARPDDGDQKQESDGETAAAANLPFSDTPASAWYVKDGFIEYVYANGIMTGYSGRTLFGPDDLLTRAQVATILYRYANPDSADTTDASQFGTVTHFEDVPTGQFYTAAVEWCYQNGIITGYEGSRMFGPEDNITREQLATMLFRFAGSSGAAANSVSATGYPDNAKISAYAWNAMGWCRDMGILTGYAVTGNAGPQDFTTRAQAAKMITVLARDVL